MTAAEIFVELVKAADRWAGVPGGGEPIAEAVLLMYRYLEVAADDTAWAFEASTLLERYA